MNGKRVYLHRHIFETQVRPLQADEIVHHKDENKQNNDPSNLEALPGHAEHLRRHGYWKKQRGLKPFDWQPDVSTTGREFDEIPF